MSAETWTPRPYVVGEENVAMVGVQGIVEQISPESLTIDGVTLPRAIGGPVRYLSMIWPDEPCDRDHCDGACDPGPVHEDALEDLQTLAELIRDRHETEHPGSMRFCDNPVCRELDAMAVLR